MDLLRSLAIAFSMYSRIPVPRVSWTEKSSRFVLLFFPLTGAAEGLLLCLALRLSKLLQLPLPLRAALFTALPYLYTGGIHLDGFLDTVDALGSWKSRKERLEILKDVHTGSFAVLSCALLCVAQFAAWSAAGEAALLPVALSFVLSRSFSALSLMCLPNARGEGSAYRFSSAASRKATLAGVLSILGAASAAGLWLGASAGAFRETAAVFLSALGGAAFAACRAMRAFGGMTGDLAGFLLTLSELAALLAAALAFHA